MQNITYRDLSNRLDNCYMFNKAPELDPEFLYEGLENGTLWASPEDEENGETVEIYQYYLIGSADADYLKRHTEEIVFWSEKLEEYIWGVTHFGTSWDGVGLNFYEDEEEKLAAIAAVADSNEA